MTLVTGVGSWPGLSARETLHAVRDVLPEPDADVGGVPYLPELPDRGPGGDVVGRSAALLVGLSVDLQPSGWRLAQRPGRDVARTLAYWREDLDELAEAFDGYAGPLKVQAAGPCTLAAALWLPRGDRALGDAGAARDLAESLAEGVGTLVVDVQRLVPHAEVRVQLDEPALPAVLEGRVPTASGLGALRAVDPQEAGAALRAVLAAAGERHTVVHCCAAAPPLAFLRGCGASGLSVDTGVLSPRGWEGLAVAVEEGLTVYAGCVPTGKLDRTPASLAASVADAWSRLGMAPRTLADLVVTPSCGLAGLSFQDAVARQRTAVEVARYLHEQATA